VSPKAWLFDFLKFATDLGAIVIAVTFWHIWEARNDARKSQAVRDPIRTATKAIAYTEMIVQHCYKPTRDHKA
jgi:hypothetical protein